MRLTADRLREVLSYDPETGVFCWKAEQSMRGKKSITAGSVHVGLRGKRYIRIGIDGVRYMAHRLAWLYVHGAEPDLEVDHINGDGCDNRISNLRLAAHQQNRQNAKKNSNNTSGIKGVSWSRKNKKWQVDIRANGKSYYLGHFETKEEAARVRREAEVRFHGDFRWIEQHGGIP